MNDTELDEMLNQWKAPEPGAELRGRIRGMQPQKRPFVWPAWHLSKGLFAGVAAGAVMCLFGISVAFPQVFAPSGVRFNLISEYLKYKDDGSSVIEEYRSSTADHGREIILHRGFPNDPIRDLHTRFFDGVHRLLGIGQAPPLAVASDCSYPGHTVIGQDTVLGYKATKLLYTGDNPPVWGYTDEAGRYTEWRAPGLDCIVMKSTWERTVNGELRLTEERRPMTVRINPAQ